MPGKFIGNLYKIALILVGAISLVWFLIRVVPKPGRAAYPCQKAAFPVASAFVLWIAAVFSGKYFLEKAKLYYVKARYLPVAAFIVVSVVSFAIVLSLPFSTIDAAFKNLSLEIFEPTDGANQPLGVAKGIYPGRVVWCYNPNATNWSGIAGVDASSGATSPQGDGDWFTEGNVIQPQVDTMLSETLCKLTGKSSDTLAWDAIFKYFNSNHNKGNVGYSGGEKIAIKINLNNSGNHYAMNGASNIAPQMVLSLLKQLVNKAKVKAECITFYDVSRMVPATIYDLCTTAFPKVKFVDQLGGNGRIKGEKDDGNPLKWSQALVLEKLANLPNTAYLPVCVTEASYIINFSNLKAHSLAGISLCAKNMFGSFIAPNNSNLQPPQAAGIHPYIAVKNSDGYTKRAMYTYNPLVDLMGNKNLGGKTLLFLIDGLFAAPKQSVTLNYKMKWKSAPFNGNWTSSLFASFDNVAIESVCLDFLRAEQAVSSEMTEVTGNVDNYLHEAALANNPPSGIVYRPNDDKTLESLGVHEHWNNATDKLYSRNLGTGNGIELVSIIHKWVPTAITQILAKNSLLVFPNPATDVVNVKFVSSYVGPIKVDIYTAKGALVYAGQFAKCSTEYNNEINIGQFNGPLILRLSIKSVTYSEKIIRK